jgi:hypothetical protein
VPQGVEVQVLSHPPGMTEYLRADNLLSFEHGGRTFDIHRGVPEPFAYQLVDKSEQAHVARWTPNDAAERFRDIESVAAHINKGRHMYSLALGEDLAGTVWYGNKEFPTQEFGPQAANQTFAIRIYEGYLRQGLAIPFMDHSLKDYILSFIETSREDTFNGLWLSSDVENQAVRLYMQYGYRIAGQSQGKVFMVLSESKIRGLVGA